MKDSGSSSGQGPQIGSLTDPELYSLQLRALGYPRKQFGGQLFTSYWKSPLRRVFTLVDAFIFLNLAVFAGSSTVGVWMLVGLFACIFNVPAGFISAGTIAFTLFLDMVPSPSPTAATLRVGSPESLSAIADYLSSASIAEAEGFIQRCQRSLAPLDQLIEETTQIETRLSVEREGQTNQCVVPLYDRQVADAREAIQRLRDRREEILRQERLAHQELATVQAMLNDMRVLAHASYQLRVVRDRVMNRTQQQDEELSRRQIANVCVQMQEARDKIASLQDLALARASAITEINEYSRAS